MNRSYICIDLKSFYASVECVERKLDPLTTHLVVADSSRTDKTICLAVTPSLKQYGIGGRARLYEVKQKVREINFERKKNVPRFSKKSYDDLSLKNDSSLELDFIIAPPRMRLYMKYSSQIYQIYLEFFAPEDVYVYSIDEVFCDITSYLLLYQMSEEELVTKVIQTIYERTGITATAGIGSNLYLAKVAMDIVAKHASPNEFGVRMATLNEQTYREILWDHKPLTDFWRVGKGIATKLKKYRIYTMGDIAQCSLEQENLLYRLFGVNAELLIDHAWGWEPCTLKDIRSYRPSSKGLSSSQVLAEPYDEKKASIIVREMAEALTLDMVDKHYVTDCLVLTIGYDIQNLQDSDRRNHYQGEVTLDFYGREVPKAAHGTVRLDYPTSSTKIITQAFLNLYQKIIHPSLLIRRISLSAFHLQSQEEVDQQTFYQQLPLFSHLEEVDLAKERKETQDERRVQQAILKIKNKYGKNSILKGLNLVEGGTMIERNNQVGGHKG